MERAILHVDMDAFYASVEQRDHPALRGRPLIVGGHPSRGVVLAASYEVRPCGVRSAMPMARALRLAPRAIVVPPRPAAYAAASRQVFAIFESVTPLVEPLSLDEAFLDVTGSTALFGAPAAIARHLRARIAAEVGLPASAGIAAVKFVAKIASDLAKPDGQRQVPAAETRAFLAPLPVARLFGVGPRAAERLRTLGLLTIGQLAQCSGEWLEERLGALGRHLHALSLGIDERKVVPDRQARSIGAEDTFAEDLADGEALAGYLHAQALRVGERLRRARLRTRVVQLKLKYADFRLVTRRTTLAAPTSDGQALYRAALALFHREGVREKLRLCGVVAQELQEQDPQLGLGLPDGNGRTERKAGRLNAALDEIHRRYGRRALVHGDLVPESGDLGDDDDEARRQVGASRQDLRGPRR